MQHNIGRLQQPQRTQRQQLRITRPRAHKIDLPLLRPRHAFTLAPSGCPGSGPELAEGSDPGFDVTA